ncbi:MAG: hypothetical protein FJ042_04785 [Candidatus Cloacimonetes bacterium]|nr:hypothetical protein [Candidatus Cloacimonadota bacterium]
MRGKLILLIGLVVLAFFFHFYNNNRVTNYTRRLNNLEKSYNAEKNISTELTLEHELLRSGRHIASLVSVEMSQFDHNKPKGSIIYVHEPSSAEGDANYCIIDLIASKAEAKTVTLIYE